MDYFKDEHSHYENNYVLFTEKEAYPLFNLVPKQEIKCTSSTHHLPIYKKEVSFYSKVPAPIHMLCGVLLFVVIVLQVYDKWYTNIISTLWIKNPSNKFNISLPSYITFHVLSVFCISLFALSAYLLFIPADSSQNINLLFAVLMLLFVGFLALKKISAKTVQVVYKINVESIWHIEGHYQIWYLGFMLSFPFTLLLLYANFEVLGLEDLTVKKGLLITYLIILSLLYLILTFNYVLYFKNRKDLTLFHIILYICTLDILPVALLIKLCLK